MSVGAVIEQFIKAINDRDFATLEGLGAPHATYWTAGPEGKLPSAGTLTYSKRIGHMPASFERMKSFSFSPIDIIVDGEIGAAEVAIKGEGLGGQGYENSAILKFVVKGGKIHSIKEYIDTSPIFALMAASGAA
ncbi:unnamed protein product [Cyclocybe aegerita]|uniref:SnoaL-like domain-containing protein n=1 Tax=Cyclocybe aegerita TaxID=1973307 RepID=A0A8S0XUN4_CYCAE|nr:unnamed protein product [Cyclocybe aegerita]